MSFDAPLPGTPANIRRYLIFLPLIVLVYLHSFFSREQWWKQDQSVKTKTKTKTKIVRPRPRPGPVKQQQECITEKKLFGCYMHVCYQKITWCKKRPKSDVWHCFQLIARKNTKEHRCLLHRPISIIPSHSVLSCTTVLGTRPKV